MSIDQYLNEIVSNVDKEIFSYLKGDTKDLYEASLYLLKAGGKRLRPLILVASSDLVGGERTRAYKAAAAVEVLHNFTLIHDDIMDQDTLRRGKPTVHVVWGVPTAILAGDLLHAKAFEILNDALRGLDGERYFWALSTFSRSVIVISEGQAMDMEFEKRADVTEAEYVEMIKRKTAQLFACSSALGGIVGGGDRGAVEKLYSFGMDLGISFQIVDDILGLTADERELGKPVYSDVREGKKTILVIKALEMASDKERKIILEGLGSKDSEKVRAAAEIIKSLSLDYAYDMAERYLDRALKSLNSIEGKSEIAGMALKYLAEFTVKRRK
ncbi:MAG: polyprenyl synthetase family protein [Candidatus Aramenus sp.]|nr:polyprenyl synthetase family protein [Candidatus Aramenus sp.]